MSSIRSPRLPGAATNSSSPTPTAFSWASCRERRDGCFLLLERAAGDRVDTLDALEVRAMRDRRCRADRVRSELEGFASGEHTPPRSAADAGGGNATLGQRCALTGGDMHGQ